MGDKIIHDATRSFVVSLNPRLAAAMVGGDNELQLAMDTDFSDSNDDDANDSSRDSIVGADGAPPALTMEHSSPPPTDAGTTSTSTTTC